MNKIKTIAAFAAASLLTFQSCSDMLDVTNPNSLNDDQIRELLASSDETKVNATLEAIGSGLEAYICLAHQALSGGFSNSYANEFAVHISRNVACENMIYGDVANSITDGWASYYNHTFNAAEKNENASCYGWWYSSSYIIAQANKAATYLTDEVATSPNALPAVKTYAAQAKTLRAYGYLQLMERFRKAYKYGGSEQQGMPIYTKYAYNTPVAPKTAQETWEWIIKELEDAGTYFAAGKNSATDGYTTVNPTDLTTFYDIDRTLSDYYLARACLDYGEYDKAIAACQRILAKYPTLIDEAHYGVQTSRLDDIATPLDDTWKKGKDEVRNDDNAFLSIPSNPEVLFGWTSESNLYSWTILNSLKAGNSKSGLFQISQSLYDKIDDNDYRKGIFADHELRVTLTSLTMAMLQALSSSTPTLSGALQSARTPMSVQSPTSALTRSFSVLQKSSSCWPRLSTRLARKLTRRLPSTNSSRLEQNPEHQPLHVIITRAVSAPGSRSSFSGR